MGHRFEISEKWGEAGGTLKFGFAQGRVKTFVLSMPIDRLIPSQWVDLQFGQDHSFLFLALFFKLNYQFSRILAPLIATWDPRPAIRN